MARYSGNKSWAQVLLAIYTLTERENINNAGVNNVTKNAPLSLTSTGDYNYRTGKYLNKEASSYYWIKYIKTKEDASNFRLSKQALLTKNIYEKGFGFSLRRVAKPPLLFTNKARSFSPTLSHVFSDNSAFSAIIFL